MVGMDARNLPDEHAPLTKPVDQERPRRRDHLTGYLLLIIAIVAGLAIWGSVARESSQSRAFAEIPLEARQGLYQRTLENLRFCKTASDAFARFCKEQAEFAVNFTECDAECKELARRFLSGASR